MTSKPAKWLIWIGIGLAAVVAAVAVVTAVVLPSYVEGRMIPRLSAEFGLRTGDIQVRRIGLWGSDIGPIQLTAEGRQVMNIAAVQIDYTPLSLIRGEIKGLSIGGLGIRVNVSPDGTSIAGVRLPTTSTTSEKDTAELDLKRLLPIQLGRLAILHSYLTLEIQDRRFKIPFALELQTGELGNGRLKGEVDVEFMGNPMTLRGSIDQEADQGRLQLEATGFRLDGLGALLPATLPVQLKGLMDLDGEASFGLLDFDLKGLALTALLNDTQVTSPQANLRPAQDADGRTQPIAVSVTGEGLSDLTWRFAPLQITGPAKVVVEDLFGTLVRNKGRWELNGDMKTVLPEQPLSDRVRIPAAWPADWKFVVRHHEGENLTDFDMTRRGDSPLTVVSDNTSVTVRDQAVRLVGTLKKGVLDAQGDLSAKGIRVSSPDANIAIPELIADGAIGVPLGREDAIPWVKGKVEMPVIDAKSGATTARLAKMTFDLNAQGSPQQIWHWDGRLKLVNGRVTDPSHNVRVRNISADLPLKWPETRNVRSGRLRVGSIQWNGQDAGSVKGALRQKNLGLTMALTHTSKLFPGVRVLINGDIDRAGSATIKAKVPRHQLAEAIDLGRYHSTAAGMMISGQVEADANVMLEQGRLAGDARFKYSQGRLHQPSRNLLLEGIDMQVHIDEMDPLESAPQQKLTVAKVTFGNLTAGNLNVDFQLEHPSTLFIEKAQIDWSDGKINTAALRIVPGVDEYDVILFCDRLNLAMVLEQLGAAQAKGDGSVNGRVPIHWANGRLSFDNGFLFSSPGQTGAIQLTGTEVLLSGLPPGTPQHAQLDIASEALKDYTYKWAKLLVQTEDDILLLKLQFDGKPNRLLPFAYDQQLGQFKRVAGEGQADFKGISIDLNLRSPLNEIMNYKELLN